MQAKLTLAAAAAALAVVAFTASTANAELGPCKGGYRMLGNGVLVTCHDNDQAAYPSSEAPLYTGSIAPARPVYVEPRAYHRDYPAYGNYYDNPNAYPDAYYGNPSVYYDDNSYAYDDGYYDRSYAYDDGYYDRPYYRHYPDYSWRDCGPVGVTIGIAPLFGASVC